MINQERKDDMVAYRNTGATLQQIATIYNLSRERVRQIIGNTGRDFRYKLTREWAKGVDMTVMTSEEIKKLPGMITALTKMCGEIHHKNNGLGDKTEELAHQILLSKGIANERMPFGCPYDILTDTEIKIDVKHSEYNIQNCPSQRYVKPTYQMAHIKQGADCDYFFVMIKDDTMEFGYAVFIIPSRKAPLGLDSRIRIPWPPSSKPSKWHQYLNRYDLLLVIK
jgi:hypothetical protein